MRDLWIGYWCGAIAMGLVCSVAWFAHLNVLMAAGGFLFLTPVGIAIVERNK